MHVIIIGAGITGEQIAKKLSEEDHDVVVIDNDSTKIDSLTEEIDVMSFTGKGSDIGLLIEAGIKNCELLIAVTNSDEANMISCFIAKNFNVKLKIARLTTSYKESEKFILNELGIDMVINQNELAAFDIMKLIHSPATFEICDFIDKPIQIRGYNIDEYSSMVGKQIREVSVMKQFEGTLYLAVIRENEITIPRGDFTFQVGDKVYLIGKISRLSNIAKHFNDSYHPVKNVMIIGISAITFLLCDLLIKEKVNVKVIEEKKENCIKLAEKMNGITIINDNPTDIDVLVKEGINSMDAFIAISDDKETNMLSTLIAKKENVKKIFGRMKKDYIPYAKSFGIDTIVNPRLSAVKNILSLIRQGTILSMFSATNDEIEVIEFALTDNSKIINTKLKDIEFPVDCLVAAIISGDELKIPTGEDYLYSGNKVIIVVSSKDAKKLEKIVE